MVLRRQEGFNIVVTTSVLFSASNEREEAGVTVFQDERHRFDLVRTLRKGQSVVVLKRCVGGIKDESSPVLVTTTSPVLLRVTSDCENYSFTAAQSGSDWTTLGLGGTRLVSTDVAGTLDGILVGVYAQGGQADCIEPATFQWFEYDDESRS
jgi:alpha-N-arabinofuranosidase